MSAAGGGRIPTVLVLCQRSRSSNDETVVETVKGLLNFIEDGLGVGREFRIRFCTPCIIEKNESNSKKRRICDDDIHTDPDGGDYSDYNLLLNHKTLPEIQAKMRNEVPSIDFFDIVILHTCPFVNMDFEPISKIMGPGGKMIMTRSRGGANEIVEVPKELIVRSLAQPRELYSRIHKYFDDTDKPGVYRKKAEIVVYEPPMKRNKIDVSGGKKKGRKNTLRYKPKRSRRYHRTKRSGSKKLK